MLLKRKLSSDPAPQPSVNGNLPNTEEVITKEEIPTKETKENMPNKEGSPKKESLEKEPVLPQNEVITLSDSDSDDDAAVSARKTPTKGNKLWVAVDGGGGGWRGRKRLIFSITYRFSNRNEALGAGLCLFLFQYV